MGEFNGYSEQFAIGMGMVRYGGSFMASIGDALIHADRFNAEKIRKTWPDEWERYRNMALHMEMFVNRDE